MMLPPYLAALWLFGAFVSIVATSLHFETTPLVWKTGRNVQNLSMYRNFRRKVLRYSPFLKQLEVWTIISWEQVVSLIT